MRDTITLEVARRIVDEARDLASRRGIGLDRLVEELLRTAIDRSQIAVQRVEAMPSTTRPTTGVKRWSRTDLRRRGLEISRGV